MTQSNKYLRSFLILVTVLMLSALTVTVYLYFQESAIKKGVEAAFMQLTMSAYEDALGTKTVSLTTDTPTATVTATATQIATATFTATSVPTKPAATAEPATPTKEVATFTPAPISNIEWGANILANPDLEPPCTQLFYRKQDDPNSTAKWVFVPAGWVYSWQRQVPGIPLDQLGHDTSPLACDKDLAGVQYDIAFSTGTHQLTTDFAVDPNLTYVVKVKYSAQCNDLSSSQFVFRIYGEIINSSGGTTTNIGESRLASLPDKTITTYTQVWYVRSSKSNPGGSLRITMEKPFGVCAGGSFVNISTIQMYPIPFPVSPTVEF